MWPAREMIIEDTLPQQSCNFLLNRPLTYPLTSSEFTLKEFGVQRHFAARNVQYTSHDERVKSFIHQHWPHLRRYAGFEANEQNLAAAGFFYTGRDDETRCYFCNGAMRDWLPDDDPREKHRQYYPNCEFLFLTDFASPHKQHCEAIRAEETSQSNAGHKIDANTLITLIDDWFKSEIVQQIRSFIREDATIVDMVIKSVLYQRWRNSGMPFENIDELYRALQTYVDYRDRLQPNINRRTFENKEYNEGEINISDIERSFLKNVSLREFLETPVDRAPESCTTSGYVTERLSTKSLTHVRHNVLTCKICLDREVTVLLLPCGHMVTCSLCLEAISKCPLCRKLIMAIVRPNFT